MAPGGSDPVEAFKRRGADFVVEREVVARDREMDNPYAKDLHVTAIHGARRYLADRITRVAAPHKLLDSKAGPLIAVKLHILTRKTLGGMHGYRAPEGTFLGGCLSSGRVAARSLAAELRT